MEGEHKGWRRRGQWLREDKGWRRGSTSEEEEGMEERTGREGADAEGEQELRASRECGGQGRRGKSAGREID